MTTDLGPRIPTEQVAARLGIDVKTVRRYYRKFGGLVIGKRYIFFENGVENALQRQVKESMDSAGHGWQEEALPSVRNEKRSSTVGGREKGAAGMRKPTREPTRQDKAC